MNKSPVLRFKLLNDPNYSVKELKTPFEKINLYI
jgi:hypothetical protein